jgi:hypothetical protein
MKDKLFFFGGYEGDFLRQAAGSFYTLPTPDMANGHLASPTPIFDPATGNPDGSGRTPFARDSAGNYDISSSRISSISEKLIAQIPSGVPNGVYTNNIYINTPFSYNLQKIDTKIDWNTTKKLRITGRFSDYPYSQQQASAFGEVLGPGAGYNTDQSGNIYAISAMATVDQLFNSSEKRLARVLLLMAEFGKPGEPESLIPAITQESLAEMVGTTRSRISFFMNRFRKLGFIEYNGRIRVHKSLLNVILHD